MNPKVSIICSCYNAENYLEASILSVLNQTFINYELIIINDGSTDKTPNILNKFKHNKYIKIFTNNENKGLFYSRTIGINNAYGEYIAIQDADDISKQDRIEKEVNILNNNNSIVFLGSYADKIDENGNVIGKMTYPTHFTEMALFHIKQYKLNPIIDPSCMFRKSIFIKHNGYNLNPIYRTCADFELWSRLLLHGYKMTNIPESLILYRVNPNGMTQTKFSEMRKMTDEIVINFKNNKLCDPT